MESFFEIHANLVEQNTNGKLRRYLMDELDTKTRLIGVKGTRGVGKTTLLLQYAKEHYGAHDHRCLYINMNNFYFQGHGFVEFAGNFVASGGQCLLIDQVFKNPNWAQQLRECYDKYPNLQIIFTGSSVMHLKDDPAIGAVVTSYNLRGFSFREYLNLTTGHNFPSFTLEEIMEDHEHLVKKILPYVSPQKHFPDYLHHGFYPFHLENRNFAENLLKTMNMMTEVDILLIKQMELKYLTKIKKLFYLLALEGAKAPNVSTMAQEVETSRATVMNYLEYLAEARLINMLYPMGEAFPKKPSKVVLHNPNLLYAIYPIRTTTQEVMETFFINTMWKDHVVNCRGKEPFYTIDRTWRYQICDAYATDIKLKYSDRMTYARYNTEVGRGNLIPLWLFGFLY